MKKEYSLFLFSLILMIGSFNVSAQKKLPSKIEDGFVLEFVAPFDRIVIQTDEKNMPNSESAEIFLTSQTKLKNHKGKPIAPDAIRAGMEIEIEIDKTNFVKLTALQIKLRTNPEERKEDIDGYLDRVEESRAMVEGRIVELAPNTILTGTKDWKGKTYKAFSEIPLGSLVNLKGVRKKNRVLFVMRGEVRPNVFTPLETRLMEAVKQGLTLPPPDKLGAGVRIGSRTFKIVEDLDVNTFVNKVGMRVVPKFLRMLPPEDPNKVLFRFYVLEDETPNAVALSDGSVFINTGLLQRLENEAQLAIILGHEIAHVTNEHSRRRFEAQQNQAFFAALMGAAAGAVVGQETGMLVSKLGFTLMSNKFSNDLEEQADRVGLFYAYDAGYDVRESTNLWKKVIGSYRESAVGATLYADHPAMMDRLKDMRREVILNYADADFREAIVGLYNFVEVLVVYFGWIQPKPKPKIAQNVKPAKSTKKTPVKTNTKKKNPPTPVVKKIPKTAIRRINFRNFTYLSVDSGFGNSWGLDADSNKKTVFRLGKHIVKDEIKSVISKILYADFNNDGVEEAFVVISSERPAAGTYWSGDFYVFEYRGGKAVQIFHRGIYKPYEIKLVSKKILTNAPFWRENDAHCCPFAIEDAVYEWKGGGFVRTSQNFKPIE